MSGPRRRVPLAWVAAGIFVAALVLAGVVSRYASSSPDGLNRVAQDQGFSDTETEHATDDSPFAGYANTPVAGVVGVLVVLALAGGLTYVVRRRPRPEDDADAGSADRETVA